ncbi:unnamed protein product, partial [Closterium sp. NIES-53]
RCPTSRVALPCLSCRPASYRVALPCQSRRPAGRRIALLPARRIATCASPCPARVEQPCWRPPCWQPHCCPHRPARTALLLPALLCAALLADAQLPARRPVGSRTALHCPCAALLAAALPCPGCAPLFPSRAPPLPALRASLVLARHPACFDTWLDDLKLYLLSDSRNSVSMFDHTFGASLAPPATSDSATRSQWLTRDAAVRLAIRNQLPLAERAHFGQHKTAKALYDAVVARYSSPTTAALGRLILPYLFPELSAFATVEDLITHLRTSDTRYNSALPAEFLDRNPPPPLPPPMYNTLYFIVTHLPDSLRALRDHFLALDPTYLTVDLLEKHLLATETSVVAVGAARGTPRTPFFEGCSPFPLAPSYASAAAVDILGTEDVGTASALSRKRRNSSKGKGGKSRGGGNGGGRGEGNGGSGGGGGGGSGGSGGGTGGFGGGGGGSGGGGGGGGGGSGSGGGGIGGGRGGASQRGGTSGGQRQQHQRRLLSHQTLLCHHRLGHPSRLLVSGLPRSLPPFPPSPAPPCLPCVEGRQRAAPHSSSFPSTSAPLQTLHMDVWGPARVSGQGHDRYFLLVVDNYTRYTTVFPLRSKGEDLPILRLHSDSGGEFSSNLLRDFCRGEGILQSFTLPASPQKNGVVERRIGLVMEVARTSMIHAAAPHFLWSFAVRYAAHQLNLWPRVSLPETSPTLCWTGKVGDASVFRVWGSRAFVRDTSADKLSSRAIPCVFLGFPPDAPGCQFYHPTSRRVLPSHDVAFDESVPFYHPLPGTVPVEVAVDSGAARGAASGGVEPASAEPGGAEPEGAEPGV